MRDFLPGSTRPPISGARSCVFATLRVARIALMTRCRRPRSETEERVSSSSSDQRRAILEALLHLQRPAVDRGSRVIKMPNPPAKLPTAIQPIQAGKRKPKVAAAR